MIPVHFQGKPFSITIIQVYAPTSNAEEAEVEWFYEDPQNFLELTLKKDILFIGDWNAKVESQEIPGVTGKFGLGIQNEARPKLTEFAKRTHWSEPTPSFYKTREDSTHGHHQMVNTKIRLIIFFAAKDGEALYSQQKQDWELTMAQIMNSLLPNSDLNRRKVGKTTRPFRYDLNLIPYDYTVEVRNRFKGLDLIDRVPDELYGGS